MSCGRVAGVIITTPTKVVGIIIKTPATKAVFARGWALPLLYLVCSRGRAQPPARLFIGYRLENAHPTAHRIEQPAVVRPRVCVLALKGCGSSPVAVLRAPCILRLF